MRAVFTAKYGPFHLQPSFVHSVQSLFQRKCLVSQELQPFCPGLRRSLRLERRSAATMPPKQKYTDPKLRDEVKEEVQQGDKGGAPGQWSARKVWFVIHVIMALLP